MKVLIPIDNKPSSQAILDAVIKMRWFEGTELHVVTVRNQQDIDITEIENLAVELHNCLPHCEVSFIARDGDPHEVLVDLAENIQAELIVMGSNCKNTLERLFVGSVCQTVMAKAHCPVFVAKTPCSLAREASPGFKNILIPIDNSIFSDVALRWLANFSWGADCRFVIAAAVEPNTDMGEVEATTNKRAFDLSRLLGTSNVAVDIVIGEPHQTILEMARKYYSDLIVMGSHGRTGLQKLILGSVSQGISRDAPCAVAIVRGIAEDENSWKRTGAFNKMKAFNLDSFESSSGSNDSYRDNSIHVLPGGM